MSSVFIFTTWMAARAAWRILGGILLRDDETESRGSPIRVA